MKSKLFVGGLPFSYSNEELKALFAGVGTVVSAEMVLDPDRGRTRGFGFVELSTPDQAMEAIASLNNTSVGGKNIYVTVARDKPAPKPAPAENKFSKTINRKASRNFRQEPGASPYGDARQGQPPAPGARPAWPPAPGRQFDKPPRRYKGRSPYDRSSPPAFGEVRPGRPPAGPGADRPRFGRPAGPGGDRPRFGRPTGPGGGGSRFGRPAAPGAGPRSPSGFSKPNKWEPRGNDKNAFSAPRRERGDFSPSRPSSKPPKKEFWRKFDKKKPRPE